MSENILSQLESLIVATAAKPATQNAGYGSVVDFTIDVPVSRELIAKIGEYARTGKFPIAEGSYIKIPGPLVIGEESVRCTIEVHLMEITNGILEAKEFKIPNQFMRDFLNGRWAFKNGMHFRWIGNRTLPKLEKRDDGFFIPMRIQVRKSLLRSKVKGINCGPEFGTVELSGISRWFARVKLLWASEEVEKVESEPDELGELRLKLDAYIDDQVNKLNAMNASQRQRRKDRLKLRHCKAELKQQAGYSMPLFVMQWWFPAVFRLILAMAQMMFERIQESE